MKVRRPSIGSGTRRVMPASHSRCASLSALLIGIEDVTQSALMDKRLRSHS